MIHYLEDIQKNITFIGEEHPQENHRVRNTNIISLIINHPILGTVLDNIKEKLIIAKKNNHSGPQQMFHIGSGTYIRELKIQENNDIIKYSFQNNDLIIWDSTIYSKNIKRWQHTYELLFSK